MHNVVILIKSVFLKKSIIFTIKCFQKNVHIFQIEDLIFTHYSVMS